MTRLVAVLGLAASAVLASACAREVGSATPALVTPVGVPAPPAIDRPVVDTTHTLSTESIDALSSHLDLLRESTGAQMAVLVVWTTGDEPIEDYSLRVSEAWQGGSEERDDGLLLTLALADRRMRLEVGYGLEARITDAEALTILDRMRDPLRAGDTEGSIALAIDEVARELPRTSTSVFDGGAIGRPAPGLLTGAPFVLAAVLCVLAFLLTSPRRKDRRLERGLAWPTPHRGWAVLAGALLLIAALLSWLYAGLRGPATAEPLAFFGSALALLPVFAGVDRWTRTFSSALSRWAGFAIVVAPAVLFVTGGAGMLLGSEQAAILLIFGFATALAVLGGVSGAAGGGSSSSRSYASPHRASSSSGASSSSSSSSSSSGRGGGFGGGGASASW
ncbi:MAG: TPM domain-containing protein [Myxococcota bacterium]|nr:TPM domain-containing protein [Myxococcota bacterium]